MRWIWDRFGFCRYLCAWCDAIGKGLTLSLLRFLFELEKWKINASSKCNLIPSTFSILRSRHHLQTLRWSWIPELTFNVHNIHHQSHFQKFHISVLFLYIYDVENIFVRCRNTFYLCKFALKLWHLYWHVFATTNYFSQVVHVYHRFTSSQCTFELLVYACILNKIVHLSLDLSSVKINWNTCHIIYKYLLQLILSSLVSFLLLFKVSCQWISPNILMLIHYIHTPYHTNTHFSLNYFFFGAVETMVSSTF